MTLGMTQRRSQSCFVALLAIGVLLDPLRPVFVLAQSPAEFDSVTDAMLQNPDPADWLNWRRTLDGWGYSPLDEINRSNVHQLQLIWASNLALGRSMPTPLVYRGVMYVPQPGSGVRAFDVNVVRGEPEQSRKRY